MVEFLLFLLMHCPQGVRRSRRKRLNYSVSVEIISIRQKEDRLDEATSTKMILFSQRTGRIYPQIGLNKKYLARVDLSEHA